MDTQEDYFETVNNEDSEGSSDDGIAQEDEYDDCVRIVSKGFFDGEEDAFDECDTGVDLTHHLPEQFVVLNAPFPR